MYNMIQKLPLLGNQTISIDNTFIFLNILLPLKK